MPPSACLHFGIVACISYCCAKQSLFSPLVLWMLNLLGREKYIVISWRYLSLFQQQTYTFAKQRRQILQVKYDSKLTPFFPLGIKKLAMYVHAGLKM